MVMLSHIKQGWLASTSTFNSAFCSARCLPGYGGAPCKPCAPGSFSLGGSSAPCAKCTCAPLSACKQQQCNSTTGSCQLVPAADGATCKVGTLPGTCKKCYSAGSGLSECAACAMGRTDWVQLPLPNERLAGLLQRGWVQPQECTTRVLCWYLCPGMYRLIKCLHTH
jgi:hypothetical protein